MYSVELNMILIFVLDWDIPSDASVNYTINLASSLNGKLEFGKLTLSER